jgi:hypothetical protein
MPDKHKHPPISVRLPEVDRLWLLNHAKAEGLPVNKVLAVALKVYRAGIEQMDRDD